MQICPPLLSLTWIQPCCTPSQTAVYRHHLCIAMGWHPSPTALQSATTLSYTTHLCLQLRWHPFQLEQVEPVRPHGWSFADSSIVAVVDLDSALLHSLPYCNLPPPPVYSNGVAPLTYCTAVCHHTELHYTLVSTAKVAPLPTRTSRTGEATRMVICRFVHRCCR